MIAKFQLSLVSALLAVLSLVVSTTDGCSPVTPEPPQTLDYKMAMSQVVVQGYVKHREPDTSFPYDDAYIVDFEIRCIFKGSPLPEMIRIHGVGSIGGLCLSTEMPEGKPLLIYLVRGSDGNYEPIYHEDPGSPQYLEEVVGLCETAIAYPEGYSETNNKEVCPEPYTYDDCVPIPSMPTFGTPDGSETTMAPPKMDETGTGTGKTDGNTGSTSSDKTNDMDKEGDHSMNKGDMGKVTGDNGKTPDAPYEAVKSNGGASDGGAVDTGDSSANTGGNEEEEDGFDPDGSMTTFTFNLLVPLAMLVVCLVLV